MEVLIKLIIVVVVILSVIKRIKEASQTQRKITGGPEGSPVDPSMRNRETTARQQAVPITTGDQRPHAYPTNESQAPHSPNSATESQPHGLRRMRVNIEHKVQEMVREQERRMLDIEASIPVDQHVTVDDIKESASVQSENIDEKSLAVDIDATLSKSRRLSRPSRSRTPRSKAASGMGFSQRDLVRGIIMSEVLGKPVSLRRNHLTGGTQ